MSEPTTTEPCRLGYEEPDGFRYCFAHAGFAHFLMWGTLFCDRVRPSQAAHERRADVAAGSEAPETQAALKSHHTVVQRYITTNGRLS